MVIATLLATALGPAFGTHPFTRPSPPQRFDETVTLPGRKASAASDMHGAWHYGYTLADASLEDGHDSLLVDIVMQLGEDGSYILTYSARWGSFVGAASGGLTVTEEGTYWLSGAVLLLEPAVTQRADVSGNTVVNQRNIPNENHVLITHVEKRRLHVAGRCAPYQVDPICRSAPANWYTLTAEIGRRWIGR